MKLEYTTDICGNALLQDIYGQHQVMMEWEKPYMEKSIEKLDVSGSVLEIGFGMGYAARKICASPHITEYTVIECAPVVWDKVEEFNKEFPHLKINLIKGRWQDVLCLADKYNRCYFDDYIDTNIYEDSNRFNKFLCEFLTNHSYIGSKISSYSTNYTNINNIDCIENTCEEYSIKVPEYCKYAKGDKMYIPVITKVKEPDKTLRENLLATNYGILNVNDNTTFKAVAYPGQTDKTDLYIKIDSLYNKRDENDNLKQLAIECDKYMDKYKDDKTKVRRMVQFYQGFAYFLSNPEKSKDIYQNLLEDSDIEDDIKGWSQGNLNLLT